MDPFEIQSLGFFLPKDSFLVGDPPFLTPVSAALSQDPNQSTPLLQSRTLEQLKNSLLNPACSRCKLCETRNQIVFGDGNPNAKLVFVGEGPGEQEDLTGKPFVGAAGQLLTKMIGAIGLKRDDVYICNVVKCRPPDNRNPLPEEIETCSPYLLEQLEAIKPTVIMTLGKFATQTLIKSSEGIIRLRGKPVPFNQATVLPTFHPSYLLRNPEAKKEAWVDLQLAAKILGISLPQRGGQS